MSARELTGETTDAHRDAAHALVVARKPSVRALGVSGGDVGEAAGVILLAHSMAEVDRLTQELAAAKRDLGQAQQTAQVQTAEARRHKKALAGAHRGSERLSAKLDERTRERAEALGKLRARPVVYIDSGAGLP